MGGAVGEGRRRGGGGRRAEGGGRLETMNLASCSNVNIFSLCMT